MTLSKVGAIESSEATELLTSSLNGYKIEAQKAMSVVDKISSIDLAAATSSYELATALARTANSANDAGVSFDKLLAMIGTVSSVTRKSASTIGESFKTIFARMGNVAAGKDTDDMGEPLNDVEKTLNKMDIALRTSEGEWRNFETVLDEVAERWKDFNSTEQSQIATAIAGVRQQENFRALMNNWKEVERLTGVAANSTGSATERMGIYLDSIEAKTNNLKNAWEGFVMSLNQSESYKQFLDWLTNVVETLQFVDWRIVGIVAGAGSLITIILKLIPAIKTLITTIKTAGIAAGIASGGIVPLLGVIITLIGGVAAAWKTASDNSEKHLDDIKKNKEELENQSKEARSLYAEYQKLEAKKNIYGLTEKEKSDLVGITKTLVEQYGFEYDSIDSLTGAYNLSQKALESYNAEVKRQMDIYNSEEYNEYIDKAKNAAKDYRSASNKGRSGWMTFTDWVGDLFGGDKDENVKEAQSAGEFAQSLISALKSSIQMETGEEISDELSKMLENAVISGFENLDEDKLKKLGEEEIRNIIGNVTDFISSDEFKAINTEIENGFKRFDKKKSSSNPLTIDDYRTLNKLYEQQASMAYGVEYKAYGDQQQAADDALKSLNENTSNLGSTLAYLNDYLKENKDITDKTKTNFELFSNDVLKLNKDFSDGKIQIQEYFDTLYKKIENVSSENLSDTFGNFETYSAVMGNAIQSITSYMQQLISMLQSAEIESDVFTTKMVDTIQSLAKFSSAYGNMYKATQGEEKYNEVFGKKDKIEKTYTSKATQLWDKKDFSNGFLQIDLTDEEYNKLKNAVDSAKDNHKDAYNNIKDRDKYIQGVINDTIKANSSSWNTPLKITQGSAITDASSFKRNKPEQYKQIVEKARDDWDRGHNANYENDIEAFTSGMDDVEKKLYIASKQLDGYADAEENVDESTKETTITLQEQSNSLDENIENMQKYADAIESWDVEKLDDAADIIQKGFETGDLSKEGINDFDKISQEYQNAAMTMAQGLVNMYTSAVELGDENMKKLAEEAYSSLGLVAGASQEQIARSLIATQSTFSNSATNMNRIAQLAMAQSLKSASGTIEQMANAIGKISVTVPIKMGEVSAGIEVAGVKIASINLDPIDTKLTIGGEGTQISGVGDAIGGIADVLANDALNSENPIMGNFYNPISPNYTPPAKNQDTPDGSGSPSTSGSSGSGSGSGYSAEDAAEDLADILEDIKDYEADIELNLEDQTEQLINHYNLEKNKLESLKEELDYYEGIYDSVENTTKWLETQSKLLENQSNMVEELQKSNDKIEKQREKIYRENSGYNVSGWFDSEGNDTLAYGDLINSFEYQKNAIQKETATQMRDVYNSVAGSTSEDAIENAKDRIEDLQKEADKRIEALDKEREKVENIHDSVSELNDAWEENQEAIRDALADMHDRIIDMRDTLVDQMMEQLEKAVDKQNESIEKDVTRMEQLVSIREKYYDILNETIDTQAELDSELQSSLDSFEYLDEQMRQLMFNEEDYKVLSETLTGIQEDIADIWEDHYAQIDSLTDDEMYKAEYITAETERQLEMKMQEYELAKAELDVAKARTNLQNVQNERNVRMFVNGQWTWVADPDAVKDAQQQLADAEREKNRIEREAEQQRLIDSMDKIIDSDNLQIDENNELLERVQEAIELQTQEVQSIEQALENIANTDLPAVGDVLQGAFGADGKSGWISELLQNINKSTSGLTLALKGYTVASAENALKNGSLSKSEFNDLVSKLGYSFNETTGIVTTPEGSFSAHYKGWTQKSNNDVQLGTANNGVQVTGGGSNANGSGGGSGASGFPRSGHVSTSSLPLRIRSGAGTNYKVLGLMPKGAAVTITGEANSGWAKVQYNGINGYASRQYLTYDQGGVAIGKGMFLKDVNVPERILSPKQTKSFDYLVKNLTTNPVLAALTKNPNVTSNLNGLGGAIGETKQYYFSNFTVQADNLTEFIDSLDAMIPISRK